MNILGIENYLLGNGICYWNPCFTGICRYHHSAFSYVLGVPLFEAACQLTDDAPDVKIVIAVDDIEYTQINLIPKKNLTCHLVVKYA